MTDLKTKEEISYIFLDSKEIPPIRLEILNFLLNLGPERETLFGDRELNEDKYPERCEKLVENINYATFVYFEKKIVGIIADITRKNGLLDRLSPFVWGFMVVKSEFQGKGIGSKLLFYEAESRKGKWKIKTGKVKIQNQAMQHINKKSGMIVIGSDDSFVYKFQPTRPEMKIFNPFVYVILRLIYIEYPKIVKYVQSKTKRE